MRCLPVDGAPGLDHGLTYVRQKDASTVTLKWLFQSHSDTACSGCVSLPDSEWLRFVRERVGAVDV